MESFTFDRPLESASPKESFVFVKPLDSDNHPIKNAVKNVSDFLFGPMDESFSLDGGGSVAPDKNNLPGYPTGIFERRVIPTVPRDEKPRETYISSLPKDEKSQPEPERTLKAPPSRITEEFTKVAKTYAEAGLKSKAETMYMMSGLGKIIEKVDPTNFGTWVKQIYQKEAQSDEALAASLHRDPETAIDAISQKVVQGVLSLLDPQLVLMGSPGGYGAARALTELGRGKGVPESVVSGIESALVAKGFVLSHGLHPLEAAGRVGALGATEAGTNALASGANPKEAGLSALEGGVTTGLFAGIGAANLHPLARDTYDRYSPIVGHEKAIDMARTVDASIKEGFRSSDLKAEEAPKSEDQPAETFTYEKPLEEKSNKETFTYEKPLTEEVDSEGQTIETSPKTPVAEPGVTEIPPTPEKQQAESPALNEVNQEVQGEGQVAKAINEVFPAKVGSKDVMVFKNPTQDDLNFINRDFKNKYPNALPGEPKARRTYDPEGNEYVWQAGEATHKDIEGFLNRDKGIETNQNKWWFDEETSPKTPVAEPGVTEIQTTPEKQQAESPASMATPPGNEATVKMMVTQQDKADLSELGYTKLDISAMAPDEAAKIIAEKIKSPASMATPSGNEATVKQPWQMTRREYKQHVIDSDPAIQAEVQAGFDVDVRKEHSDAVAQAVKDGKSVPEKVLDEYPGLKKSEVQPDNERWKITQNDFVGKATGEGIRAKKGMHKRAVEQALSEGKDVPPEVLADYPDLAKRRDFTKDLPPMQAKKVNDALDRNIKQDGKLTTRRAMIEGLVADGATVVPSKTGRRLQRKDGSFYAEKDISKTAMDYAEHLTKPSEQSGGEVSESTSSFAPEAGFRRQPEPSQPTDTPQKRSDIVKFLSEKLDIPIRTGRFRGKGVLGIFKVGLEIIRSGKANDIETISHEVGHALQKFLWPEARTTTGALAKQPFKEFSGELIPLATKPKEGQPIEPEGFAEFVRLYITDPEAAKAKAPEFYKYFEGELDRRSPESKAILLEARKMYDRWLKQPELARVLSQISVGQNDKPKKTFEDLYTATLEDLNPLKNVVDEMAKGEKIKDAKNPYTLARLFRGWTGKAEHFLEKSPFKFGTYENVGKSLKAILTPVKDDLDLFRAYLVSKRALELSNRGIETGILKNDALKIVSDHEQKFESIRQDLLDYQDHTLQYLRDAGMISEKVYQSMKAANEEYIPFYRVMEGGKKTGGTGKGFETSQPTKRIKGSWRDIVDPLESIVKNTYIYINAAEKNAVGLSLVDLAGEKEGLGKYIEKIPTPLQGIKIDPGEVKNFLKKIIEKTDMDIESLDAFLEEKFQIFRPTAFTPKFNVISVWKDGKRSLYEVHPDIARVFQSLDKESIDTVTRLLSYPARWLRAGATLTPEFIGRNPLRDQFSAFVYSKYGYVPGVDFIRGLFHAVKKDDLFWQWQKGGGAQSMLVSMDRDYLQKNLGQVLREHPRIESAVTNPIEALRILSELTEAGARLGEFGKGIKKEGATKEGLQAAAFASREVTLDFSRIGAKTKAVNMIVAFWNANLQGIDKMIRAFKGDTLMTSMRVAASITLPSLLLAWANHDDPRYKEIPRWQKDMFWIVMTEDNIYRIPKPFELGILFGSVPERMMESFFLEDKTAYDEIGNTLTSFIPSLIPTAALPLMENWANKSFFFGGPLVPEGKQDLLAKYQYSNRTTETAKILGKVIDKISITKDPSIASPAKIENLIRGWSGGLGKYALELSDFALSSTGAIKRKPQPEKTLADRPFIKGFVIRYPSSTSASITKFYDQYGEASKIINTAQYLIKKEGDVQEAKELLLTNSARRAKEIYSGLRNASACAENIYNSPALTPERKRMLLDKVYKMMISMASSGNMTLARLRSIDSDFKKKAQAKDTSK